MKSTKVLLAISLFSLFNPFTRSIQAQKATSSEYLQSFPTYGFSDPNPVARIGKIYPYFRFDQYEHASTDRQWKIVALENDWIKVLIMPEQGGKIIGAIEKSSGNAFIYMNKVVKFRDIAMRGAWTSGGIEFNFGSIGHAPTTATPVDYELINNDDGSVSCWLGTMDLSSRTEWRVEVRVPADKAWFETHAFWYNPTDLSTSKYQWMNASADATDDLVYYWPGQYYIGHGGDVHDWPLMEDGRNLSVYPQNNYDADHSYHVTGKYTDFFGGYYFNKDFGFAHLTDYAEKPGKKIWIWALSRQGAIWKDLLTDPGNNQYTEIQTGILFNQAASGSTFTPYKHLGFTSMNTERFTEYWMPVVGTGGLSAMGEAGALNIGDTREARSEKREDSKFDRGGGRRLDFMALGFVKEEMSVRLQDGKVESFEVDLQPIERVEKEFGSEILEVKLGGELLWSSEDEEYRNSERPNQMADFKWSSLQGKYYTALEWSRQREYSRAIVGFQDCLSDDPNYIPALNGLAEEYIRVMKYDQALELLKRALSVDTYEPQANYLYGVCWMRRGETGEKNWIYQAKEAFGLALRSMEFRSAAYARLADIAIIQKDFESALRYARSAQDYNRYNIPAIGDEIIALRLSGNKEDAKEKVKELLRIDPINYLATHEGSLLGLSTQLNPRNEFPEQTFLELAIRYYHLGLNEEALRIFAKAPENPLILYWMDFVKNEKLGSGDKSHLSYSTELVFPYRYETLATIEYAESNFPSWQNRYYMALVHWNMGNDIKAAELLKSCGDDPEEWHFYLTRAQMFGSKEPELVMHDLERALELGKDSWRTHLAFIEFYLQHGKYPEALLMARKADKMFNDNFIVRFTRAKAELYNNEFSRCLDILSNIFILPNEGARAGHDIYRKANILSALELLKKRQYEKCASHLDQARLWPENLGVGKPYISDERIEDYLTAICYLQTDNMDQAAKYLNRVVEYTASSGNRFDSQYLIYLFSLRLLNHEEEAKKLLTNWIRTKPIDPVMNWARACFNGQSEDAELAARYISGSETGTPWDPGQGDAAFTLVYEVVRQVQIK